MHAICVKDKGRIGDVVLPGRLREAETLLEDAPDGLGHRLRPPGLHWSAIPVSHGRAGGWRSHAAHEGCVLVPALLPHRLELVLVAVAGS